MREREIRKLILIYEVLFNISNSKKYNIKKATSNKNTFCIQKKMICVHTRMKVYVCVRERKRNTVQYLFGQSSFGLNKFIYGIKALAERHALGLCPVNSYSTHSKGNIKMTSLGYDMRENGIINEFMFWGSHKVEVILVTPTQFKWHYAPVIDR